MFPIEIFYAIIGLIALVILFKLFAWPFKMLIKLVVNGILGAVFLLLFNFIGQIFGLHIAINAATALIAGFFGIPGVIFLIVLKLFL